MYNKHYTQEPSELSAERKEDSGLLRIRGGGFVTRKMVDQTLGGFTRRETPSQVLVDLREVAGYDADAAARAQQWLSAASRLGVRRIAFVASSSVLRTAARVANETSKVDVRTFEHEHPARRWLER